MNKMATECQNGKAGRSNTRKSAKRKSLAISCHVGDTLNCQTRLFLNIE